MNRTLPEKTRPVLALVARALCFIGVHLGKEGVYLDELPQRPRLQVRQGMLTLQTARRCRNRVKEVFRIEVTPEGGAYVVRAFQRWVTDPGAVADFRHQQGLTRTALGNDPRSGSFVWMDPDGRQHPLAVEGWKPTVGAEDATSGRRGAAAGKE